MKPRHILRISIAALCFVTISAILWIGWQFLSNLILFPNDIIGTYYEVPIPNDLKVVVINTPDNGSIADEDNEKIVNRVDSLQVVGDYVIGRDSSVFFFLNTITQSVSYFDSKDDLKEEEDIDFDSLYAPTVYYERHRKPYDVLAIIVIVLTSLASSILISKKHFYVRNNR